MTGKTLTTILELKGIARDQVAADIRARKQVLRDEEARLMELERALSDTVADFSLCQTRKNLQVQDIEIHSAFCSSLQHQIARQKERIDSLCAELAALEQALLKADRERRQIKRLQEKHVRQELKESLADEQKKIDERTVLRRSTS